MTTIYLELEEILRLHFQLIEDFGGSHGVRDESRLKSVGGAPCQEVFGVEQYPTIYEKSAVYLRNIIGDHPLSDGNKRTAITVCAIFLARNAVNIDARPQDLENFTVRVATDHLGIDEIAGWLQTHSN
jgi:death-on-curing protein